MNDLDLGRELLHVARSSIDGDESAMQFVERVVPLITKLKHAQRKRRGLTAMERELFEALNARLAKAQERIVFALQENTVDHALPSLREVRQIYQGAAFLEAMLLEPAGPNA
jgi:hypothetical protein